MGQPVYVSKGLKQENPGSVLRLNSVRYTARPCTPCLCVVTFNPHSSRTYTYLLHLLR